MSEPYYSRGGITLYHGDCEAVMEALPAGSVDLAFTSPPYNMGMSGGGNGAGWFRASKAAKGHRWCHDGYEEHDDAMPHEEYVAWQHRVIRAVWRLLAGDGALFYNHRPRSFAGMGLVMPPIFTAGVPLRQIVTWDRGSGRGTNTASFSPVYEWLVIAAGPSFRLVSEAASAQGDVWRHSTPSKKNGHPAPFPLDLPMRAIQATGAGVVLDPFAGSGTALAAAKRVGVRAIGIELSERYCEIAAARLDAEPEPLFPASVPVPEQAALFDTPAP